MLNGKLASHTRHHGNLLAPCQVRGVPALGRKDSRTIPYLRCMLGTFRSESPEGNLSVHRRSVLSLTALVLLPAHVGTSKAFDLFGGSETKSGLPKSYEDSALKLVAALKESIEVDLSDAEERELRRTANTAKDLVREWMTKWSSSPVVQGSESHRQIRAAIQELGEFYIKQGQRARLPSSLGQSLLARLDAAATSLGEPAIKA
eukprot:jgi/Botrbrau1/10287/Bobra.0120s0009.1